MVGGLPFDASSLAFRGWGLVSAFAGSRAHLGVTMLFYSGPWVLWMPERVHSLPRGGIFKGLGSNCLILLMKKLSCTEVGGCAQGQVVGLRRLWPV